MTAIWATSTAVLDDVGEKIVMLGGDFMSPGDFFTSDNTHIVLIFQEDGNLVLTNDSAVLWSSGTDGHGATSVAMQADGNLVVYADAVVLWASNTNGNPNSVLVLRENGNLAIYNFGGSENLGVLSLLPDWSDTNPETLEWSNAVSESPLSVEQRMGLRFSPRKMLELGYVLFGTKRTYFDLLMTAAGGSPMWVPLFYDSNMTDLAASIGDKTIHVDTRWSELRDSKTAILLSGLFDHEVVEIWSYDDSSLTLVNPLLNDWPKGTRIYPVMKAKVETPLAAQRYADRAIKGRMRFQSLESNISTAVQSATFGTFENHPVLERDPNDVDPLAYQYDRKTFNIDNDTGLQIISDVAPFSTLAYAWFAKGKQALWELRGVLYMLEGRRVPIWIPSFFADFELAAPGAAIDTTITVKRCGYTDTGGPFKNREFIVIHVRGGSRLYFRVTAAAIVGDGSTEELSLNAALGVAITPDSVRISFLFFCRMDQDSVEIAHQTALYGSRGVTTISSVFRLDPGIAGLDNWTSVEVNPADSGRRPIIDPFRGPDGKAWLYHPQGGTPGGDVISSVAWAALRSETDTGFSKEMFFPGGSFIPANAVNLPDTGSFLVRFKINLAFGFGEIGEVPEQVRISISFANTGLADIEVIVPGLLFFNGGFAEIQSSRLDIASSRTNPVLPIVVSGNFNVFQTVNTFPHSNPENDPEPYHGDLSAGGLGDSALVVEWWA